MFVIVGHFYVFVFCLGGSPVLAPKVAAAPPERSPAPTPPLGPTSLRVNLHLFRKNVSELRLQLQHMRQLQVIKSVNIMRNLQL